MQFAGHVPKSPERALARLFAVCEQFLLALVTSRSPAFNVVISQATLVSRASFLAKSATSPTFSLLYVCSRISEQDAGASDFHGTGRPTPKRRLLLALRSDRSGASNSIVSRFLRPQGGVKHSCALDWHPVPRGEFDQAGGGLLLSSFCV